MPKLTSDEKREFERRLRTPQEVGQFCQAVGQLRERLGFWSLVQDSPFRDAFVAEAFARARRASTVWLGADPPDFNLRGVSGCDVFEAVETYPMGRRRSDEYRLLALADDKRTEFGEEALSAEERALFDFVHDPEEDWEKVTATATPLLRNAVELKASKNYPSHWGLVTLLDLGGFVSSEEGVVQQMSAATEGARLAFHEVWVLWHDQALLAWEGGEAKL